MNCPDITAFIKFNWVWMWLRHRVRLLSSGLGWDKTQRWHWVIQFLEILFKHQRLTKLAKTMDRDSNI